MVYVALFCICGESNPVLCESDDYKNHEVAEEVFVSLGFIWDEIRVYRTVVLVER